MAHKKAGSSSKNGRDSVGQRLGVKRGDGQLVSAGSIIVRQRGMTFQAGEGAGLGRDYTVFATRDGHVKFEHATRDQEARPGRSRSRNPPRHRPRRSTQNQRDDHRRAHVPDGRRRRSTSVKPDIHPKYQKATVHCGSCGTEFQVGSTRPELRVDVCSNCHPFFTGKQTIIDTAGQVERFQRRLERQARA